MTKQKYLPEMNIALTKKSSDKERMIELFEAIKNQSVCYGRILYCSPNTDYIIVDLGFGITGYIPKRNISINRKFSVAHSLEGKVINFIVEDYTEGKGFILNRLALQIKANKWQHENFSKGDIIKAKVTKILDKGILVDIGGGVETFIPPQKLVKSFEKDFNKIFEIGQIISLKVEGFDSFFDSWSLNYADCPQFGISINSTYAVSVDKKKSDNAWYCSFLDLKLKGYLIIKSSLVEIGDIEKATIVAFKKGVPLLKAI